MFKYIPSYKPCFDAPASTDVTSFLPGVGAGLNFINSGIQRDFEHQQTQMANRFNLEMWNRQNEYNTPAAQMQRFKDAGLSPHLIYGRGESGNAGAPPSFVKAERTPMSNPVVDYLQLKAIDKDIEAKDSQEKMLDIEYQKLLTEVALLKAGALPSDDNSEVLWGGFNLQSLKSSDLYQKQQAESKAILSAIANRDQDTANKLILNSILSGNEQLKGIEVDMAKYEKQLWDKYQIHPDDPDMVKILKYLSVENPNLRGLKSGIFDFLIGK